MPYQAITRAELRTRLTEFWEGKPFWTTDEANRAINEALRDWNQLTGRWRRTLPIATTIGTHEYGLPSTLMYQTRVAFNGIPMSPGSVDGLNNGQPRWRDETTATTGVPDVPTIWVPVTLLIIRIWPADATGNNALLIDGIATTPVLTADGDFVDLAEADVSVLLGYALHVASLKKGGHWFTESLKYFRAFLQAAGSENSRITTSQVYRQVMGLTRRDAKPIETAPATIAQLAMSGGDDQ